jgi:PAS domain S-box-containing protein
MVHDVAVASIEVNQLQSLYTLTDRLYRAKSVDDVFAAGLDAITETLGCSRASILLFDEKGVMQFRAWRGLSDSYRQQLKGHTPWRPGEAYPDPIFVTDIAESDEDDWVKKTILKEGIRSLGFIPLTVGGGVVGKFMTYYAERRNFAKHERNLAVTIARHVGFSIERARSETLRRHAEEDLRQSEARFRLMSEDAPVMIWMSDRDGACLHLNRMLRDAWGVKEEEVSSFDWRSTMHPEDIERVMEAVMTAMQRKKTFSVKGRYRTTDGSFRVLETNARPRFSASGEFLGMIGVNVDITEKEAAAEQRELIFHELNHRVKNTLALVQAIAHQTLKGSDGVPLAKEFEGRLGSLARAHNLLTQTNWENAPLNQLVRDALMLERDHEGRYSVCGPDVNLPPKQALAIALALHELNTNAMKYGALSCSEGKVKIDWRIDDGATLIFNWEETGGPPVEVPKTPGFGTLMIERVLPSDLDGDVTLQFLPEGVRCTLTTSLERKVRT